MNLPHPVQIVVSSFALGEGEISVLYHDNRQVSDKGGVACQLQLARHDHDGTYTDEVDAVLDAIKALVLSFLEDQELAENERLERGE